MYDLFNVECDVFFLWFFFEINVRKKDFLVKNRGLKWIKFIFVFMKVIWFFFYLVLVIFDVINN